MNTENTTKWANNVAAAAGKTVTPKKRAGGKWWWNSYSTIYGWYIQSCNPFCPMSGEDKAYRPIGIVVTLSTAAVVAGVVGAIASAIKR